MLISCSDNHDEIKAQEQIRGNIIIIKEKKTMALEEKLRVDGIKK